MQLPSHPNQGKLIEMAGGDEDQLRHILIDTINQTGSKLAAAKELGVTHTAVNRWCRLLGIAFVAVASEKAS